MQEIETEGEGVGPEIVDVVIAEAGHEVVDSVSLELASILREGGPTDERLTTLRQAYGEAFLAAVAVLPGGAVSEAERVELIDWLLDEFEPSPLAAWAVADVLSGLDEAVMTRFADRYGDLAVEPLLHQVRPHGEPEDLTTLRVLADVAPQRLLIWGERLFNHPDLAAWGSAALRLLGPVGRPALLEFASARRAETRLRAIDALMAEPAPELLDVFRKRLEKDRSGRVRDALRRAIFAIEQEPPIAELEPTAGAHAELDARMANYATSLPNGLETDPLPPLRWTSGAELSEGARKWVLGRLGTREHDDDLVAIRHHLQPRSKTALLAALREQFDEESREGRIGWVLFAAAILAPDREMADFGRGLEERARTGSNAEAFRRLLVMTEHGAPAAIQWLDHWARNASRRGIRSRARDALAELAADRGLSPAELAERAMGGFGFDERGVQTIEWSSRGPMTLRLGPSNAIRMFDAKGKEWTRYPGVLKADDPAEVERAKEAVSSLKRQVKQASRGQIQRMEEAMATGRRWHAGVWREVYAETPLNANLARHLLWAAIDADGAREPFRVAGDRTLADVDDTLFDPGDRAVEIVHPLHLDDSTRRRWTDLFVDYELIAPFPQLDRPTFQPDEAERSRTAVTRFADAMIDPDRLRYHFDRQNWIQGDPQDAALVHWVTRPFHAHQVTAAALVEPGFSVVRGGWEEPQQIERIEFFDGITRNPYWRDVRRIRIADVDPVLFSETLYDVWLLAVSD